MEKVSESTRFKKQNGFESESTTTVPDGLLCRCSRCKKLILVQDRMHTIFVQSAEVILRYVLMREQSGRMRNSFLNRTESWSEKTAGLKI